MVEWKAYCLVLEEQVRSIIYDLSNVELFLHCKLFLHPKPSPYENDEIQMDRFSFQRMIWGK